MVGVLGAAVLVFGAAVELLGTAVVETGAAVVAVGNCVEVGVAVVAMLTAGQRHTCLQAVYFTLNRVYGSCSAGTGANQDDKVGSNKAYTMHSTSSNHLAQT